MKRGTKYFAQDGTQLAVYFMEVMNITQGVDGSFSHRGTKNMDEGGKDGGIDPAFAPFNGTITWKQTTGDKTGILFSSDAPIRTVKYDLVYVNILFWHDNDTSDLYKGKKIQQGEHIYDEGTAGRATGNHIHYGVSIGKYNGGYPLVKNSFGNWELPNEVNPWDVFYINDTTIRKSGGYPWQEYRELKPAPVPTPTPNPTFKLGDKVVIIGNKWATGQTIPLSVKNRKHVIGRLDETNTKALLVAAATSGGNIIAKGVYSWIYLKDIQKI